MNRRIFTAILIAIGLAFSIGYVWGVLTIYKQAFPFEQIKVVKRFVSGESISDVRLNEHLQERRDQFEMYGQQAKNVMIGDSITHAGHWRDMFPTTSIANRGIANDKTVDVINRIESIISVKPKNAFIMIGINDFIKAGRSVESVFDDYRKIVVKLTSAGINVYIQSTLECRECGDSLGKVRELNILLESLASDRNVSYININRGLTDRNGLMNRVTYDGIHLRGIGYEIWRQHLTPYLSK